ncbi:hypothetical protein LCGC14_2296880 [marine sediment metagenome]|uniref:Uncharacterized protein n=1 Tax=marine sediment metagenome TaxID=412755 RepID=A0A0F9CPN4_9ZZZZ
MTPYTLWKDEEYLEAFLLCIMALLILGISFVGGLFVMYFG